MLRVEYKFKQYVDIENCDFANVDELIGKIYLSPEDDLDERNSILIGEVELHYYNFFMISNDGFNLSMFNAFDRKQSSYEMGFLLINEEDDSFTNDVVKLVGEPVLGNILVIDRVVIKDEYRKKGYGEKVIKSIESYYSGRCVLIAGQSYPLQHQHKEIAVKLKGYKINLLEKDPKKAQGKLNKYYKKLGYSMIKKWDKYFFIKNIDSIHL